MSSEAIENMRDTRTRDVDCGKCVACCQAERIILRPWLGDDPADYILEPEPVLIEGMFLPTIAHTQDGDCVYLDRASGCTIHDRRPLVCGEFDCGEIIRQLRRRGINPKSRVRDGTLSKAVYKAGLQRSNAAR